MKRAMDGLASSAARARDDLSALLARAGQGDRDALPPIYERTSAKLYGICLRVLGSEAEAQDALQETYVTAWRRAATFDPGRASPITWLALIAHSRSIDLRRRRGRPAEPIESAGEIADDAPDAESLAVHADEASRLHHCLETLEGPSQSAIRAAFLDGMSYPELAAREGVPLGTMKSWIRRGLHRLKGCMDQ